MESADLSQIKSMEELRNARNMNEQRLAQAKDTLTMNFKSLQESLQMTEIFANMFSRSLSLASDLYFYRKGILFLRSLLTKRPKKRRSEKTQETSADE